MALVLQEHNLNKAHPLFLNSLTHKQLQPKSCSHTNTMQTNANFLPVMGHCHVQKNTAARGAALPAAANSKASYPVASSSPATENKGRHWVGGDPTKNISSASDKHCLTLLPTPEPFILLPGPVPPGNKGKHLVSGGPTKLQSSSSCCQVQACQETKENSDKHCLTLLPTPEPIILLPSPVLPGNREKHLVGGGPIQSCQETKENIGLVVVLPRTYPLPVANTLPHCCQLQSLSSCCQVQSRQETKENIWLVVALPSSRAPHPAAKSRPARKQRKTVTNTVSHCCQLQSLSSCCQAQSCQETEKNIWLVVVLSSPARKQRKTLGWWWSYQELIHCQWQTLSHIAANSRAFHPVARSSPARKQRKTFG